MENFFDFIRTHPPVKRLQVNDLLLAEYQCPITDDRIEIWSQHNYFIFVTSGEKKWFTLNQEMKLKPGDCLFVRKGAQSVYQYFNEDFCALVLFVPDAFIRSVLLDNQISAGIPNGISSGLSMFSIPCDERIKAYFQSFFTYLSNEGNTNTKLIELKFKELVILAGTTGSKTLSSYFASLCRSEKASIRQIMEDNFNYPMSQNEFARLCGRSLSAFKRDFNEVFDMSPGRWLLQKRLELARYMLANTGKSVMEIALDSGFNHHSHFSRVFKEKFGMSPVEMVKTTSDQKLAKK